MRYIMKNFVFIFCAFVLVACGGSKEYTIEELYNDNALREKIIAECKEKANAKEDVNCRNAVAAHKRHFSGSGGTTHNWQ